MTDTITFLRSLGFGGLLGGGIGGLIYLLFPGLFPDRDKVSLEGITLICGLIGAGFHGFFSKLVTGNSGKFVVYYMHLATLLTWGRLLGKRRQQEMIERLTAEHIFGKDLARLTDLQANQDRLTVSNLSEDLLNEPKSSGKTLGRRGPSQGVSD
jgi:hypothetical protein